MLNGYQVVKEVPSSQESFEWSEEHRTAMKAPSNQDGKEGSQASARRAPSYQQDLERPVASRERSAVRRARLRRVFNSLPLAPISHGRARSVREGAG